MPRQRTLGGREWGEEILAMYRAYARERQMQLVEIAALGRDAGPVLVISGYGASRTLGREAGLHVYERDEKSSGRIAVRVLTVTPPAGMPDPQRLARYLSDSFAASARAHAITRRYRRTPDPLVANADGSWRTRRIESVLGGSFDLVEAMDRQR
ncbi:MAG: hypothetical protein R3D33_12200 [Hyphomicrobiaceae bacterium]